MWFRVNIYLKIQYIHLKYNIILQYIKQNCNISKKLSLIRKNSCVKSTHVCCFFFTKYYLKTNTTSQETNFESQDHRPKKIVN